MKEDEDKSLALKVSIFNSIGFVTAVSITTYVDPLLTSHVRYHARTYEMGYWTILLSIFIFLPTYLLIHKFKQCWQKCFVSWVPPAVVGISVLWFFKPEFPHANIATWVSAYAGVSVITVWIKCKKPDMLFVTDGKIAQQAKIEALKSYLSTWRTLTIGLTAGYLAIIVPWITELWKNNQNVVTDAGEIFLLSAFGSFEVMIFSIYVVVGPIKECFDRTLFITRHFSKIEESKH